jgi:hypothetical protein
MCDVSLLWGKIEKGDFQLVLGFLAANHPHLSVVNLNSAGGDVDEALRIGRLFRRYLISTSAPLRRSDGSFFFTDGKNQCRGYNCGICASACALIWFGGINRTGTVGLHRPTTDDPSFRQLSAADASALYRRWKRDISDYLVEMEVPQSVIELTDTIGSDELRWVDSIDDRLDHPPSIFEWVKASCPTEGIDEIIRRTGDIPHGSGKALLEQFECEKSLLNASRARLLPPNE